VDIAKGLVILLVLLGHLLMSDALLKKSIYAFHMPFFFIAAGFFLPEKPFKQYLSRRFLTLIVPYFFFAMFYGMLSLKNIPPMLYATNQSLLKSGSNGMLWFLPSLFFALLVGHLLKNRIKGNLMLSIITIVTCISLGYLLNNQYHGGCLNMFRKWGLPFAIDVVLISSAFVLIGYLFAYRNGLQWLNNRPRYQLAIMSLLVCVVLLSTFYETRKQYPQMATGDLGNWYVYFVVAVIATMGILSFSCLLSSFRWKRWLVWFGENSLTVFLVHRMLVGILNERIIHGSNNILLYILSFVLLCVFSTICTMIINKYFPYLVGKPVLTK
jgi:fucose 4-O-acetylase-like acetyltransferase